MRELLRLIKCEFEKLKRKKFIIFVIAAAFIFPIPMTYLMTTPSMLKAYYSSADAFDGLFNIILGYGIQFLLPCIIGIVAAMLFFMERDNDTFKNLRVIPITSRKMIFAKVSVLFIISIIFCIVSTLVTGLCGMAILETYGMGYKLILSIETGIFITAGTLPLIVLVVFFNRNYIFSILMCIFYSVLNMSATALFDTLPKGILLLLPTPLTTFWSAGDMASHGIRMDLQELSGLIPSTFQVVVTLGIMAAVSLLLIVELYKRWEE
ncbi:ABC transporter permease [Clostridium butyricum]